MRRFIVGLFATVGALVLLLVVGGIALVASWPFSAKPLPQQSVLALDLRSMPPEAGSNDLLSGDLFRSSRDIVEVLQLLWQAADDPHHVGDGRVVERRRGRHVLVVDKVRKRRRHVAWQANLLQIKGRCLAVDLSVQKPVQDSEKRSVENFRIYSIRLQRGQQMLAQLAHSLY